MSDQHPPADPEVTDRSSPQPWERMDGEPRRWFTRFENYRLAGPGRSLLGQVNAERDAKGRKKTYNSPGSWRKAAERWQWRSRADAWDESLSNEQEARWRANVMGPSEVLSRLSDEGRANPVVFFVKRSRPFCTTDGEVIKDSNGNIIMVDEWDIDPEALKTHGHLIKSLSWTAHGPRVELYSSQEAKIQLGKHHKLFTDQIGLAGGDGQDLVIHVRMGENE